jgi:hypothetical protein
MTVRMGRYLAMVSAVMLACETRAAGPVSVMVFGTYHFANPGLDLNNVNADDVLKPRRQRELQSVVCALSRFRPTKIMIERVVSARDLIDGKYAQFTPADLGRNRDERVQIAYRLASRLTLRTVYGIDEQPSAGEPDYFPFGKVAEWAGAHGEQARLDGFIAGGKAVVARIEALQRTKTIGATLLEINRPERAQAEQSLYYHALYVGDTEQQPGAELNAYWYMRNAKIFAKLMTVAKPGDRILVVYGAGHNYWLRHFARTVHGYRSVDPTPYLRRATGRPNC